MHSQTVISDRCVSRSARYDITSIDTDKSQMIVAALFGAEELGLGTELTRRQNAQIKGLRTAMGLE